MNKIFLILLIALSFFSLATMISAQGIGTICIDLDPPIWLEGTSLELGIVNLGIQLNWNSAIDEPECSGISHYDIYKKNEGGIFDLFISVEETGYVDEGPYESGSFHEYVIHAVDLAGHESEGISASITLLTITPTPTGGGRRSLTSIWECGNWSECGSEGVQIRICKDIRNFVEDRIESRSCVPEFIPIDSELGEQGQTLLDRPTTPNFLSRITGAVIGALGTGGTIFALLFVVLIVASFIAVTTSKKR